MSNKALVLNGPDGYRRCERKVSDGKENMFPHCRFKQSESQANLPIMTRPTLDSRELTRITGRNKTSYGI